MSRFTRFAVVVLATMALMVPAAEASAGSIHVHASAKARVSTSGVASAVVFRAKLSRRGLLRVSVYKGGKKLRVLRVRKMSANHVVVWNVRDSKGRKVNASVYSYKLAAVSGKRSGSASGKVHVKPPTTPPPSSEPTTPPAPSDPSTSTPPSIPPSDPGTTTPPSTPPSDPGTTTPPASDPGTTVTPPPSTPPVTPPAPITPPTNPPVVPQPSVDSWIGFYVSDFPASTSTLDTLETKVGHASVVNWFISDGESFPTSKCQTVSSRGSIPMITLEFWSTQTGGVSTITNGAKDAYLGKWADAAKAYGKTVWIRPFHEMNSNWYPWAGASGSNTPAQVVAAWKHMKNVFTAHGATNVKFVWCVNNESVPNTTANQISAYWPGDSYVDYLAIDAYNFGTTQAGSTWRSFTSIMGTAYSKVTALSTKPLFLAETASVEQGGDKAAWIADMFSCLKTKYPRVKGFCWFNGDIWHVDSTSASLAAFKKGVAAGF